MTKLILIITGYLLLSILFAFGVLVILSAPDLKGVLIGLFFVISTPLGMKQIYIYQKTPIK